MHLYSNANAAPRRSSPRLARAALLHLLWAIVVATASSPLLAANTVWLDSAVGDSLLEGRSLVFDSDTPGHTLSFSGDGPGVGMAMRSATESWSLGFAPPPWRTLAADWYPDVDVINHAKGLNGSIFILGNNTQGCATSPGRVVIRELGYEANSTVINRLAMDFEIRCGASTASFKGYVRWNSAIPKIVPEPTAFAGVDRELEEGSTVTLDARASLPGAAAITSFAWRQLSGPTAVITNANSAVASILTPQLPQRSFEPLVFEVRVANGAGLNDTDTVTVTAYDTGFPPNLLVVDSPPGEWVGDGQRYRFTGDDTAIVEYLLQRTTAPGLAGATSDFQVIPDFHRKWTLAFFGPIGSEILQPGNYELAARGPPVALGRAGMDISAAFRGCNRLEGRFVVLESVYDTNAKRYSKLAIDFEQRCLEALGNLPLKGALRIRSTVPLVRERPDAAAGADQVVSAGSSVQLDGNRTIPGTGSITTWRWRQLTGPAVTLSSPTQPTSSFTAPANVTGSTQLTFELEVTSSNGQTHTDTMAVTVQGSGLPRSFFQFTSDTNDAVGGGSPGNHGEAQGFFQVFEGSTGNPQRDFRIQYTGTIGSTPITWNFRLRAPSGDTLRVDHYDDAQGVAFGAPKRPGLSVGGGLTNTSCSESEGRFTILEIAFDSVTGELQRLAVDLAQRCLTLPNLGWLRGQLRYKSAIPAIRREPTAVAGRDRMVQERDDVVLDGSWTLPGEGTIDSWQWSQVSGPTVVLAGANTTRARFVAPVITTSTAISVFELVAISTNGERSSDRVSIVTTSKRAPRSYVLVDGQSGSYIGNGVRHWLLPQDGDLAVTSRAQELAAQVQFQSDVLWNLYFLKQAQARLTPGTYANAGIFQVGGPTSPAMAISGHGRACSQSIGTFRVLEVLYNASGQFDRLAIDFEHYCDGLTIPTFGEVRYNATLPDANAGGDQTVASGTMITADGSQSSTPSGNIVAYVWKQLSGPAISLSGANTARPQWATPSAPAQVTLELLVEDSRGFKDRDTVTYAIQLAPVATLTTSASNLATNQPATLNWSANNATQCGSSGGIAGDGWTATSRPLSGSATVTAATAGTVLYRLTCQSGTQSVEASVTVTYVAAPTPPSTGGGGGGGGGGAMSAWWLTLLALLTVWHQPSTRECRRPFDRSFV